MVDSPGGGARRLVRGESHHRGCVHHYRVFGVYGGEPRVEANMGLLRKINSVTTLGMVRFRTPDERTARRTRQTRNAVRQGNQYLYRIQRASAQPVVDSTVMSMRNWITRPAG
jgi:hypothetical protein